MKCSVINISPKLAEKMLVGNEINRNVSHSLVDRYARDMRNGNWQLNGEPITFNKSKQLTNGQHRLLAIIRSGKTIPMVVIEEVDDDVNIYDRNRPRKVQDSLVFSGMDKVLANSFSVALSRMVFYIKTGEQRRTDTEIGEFLSLNEETVVKAIRICAQGKTASFVPTKSASFLAPVFFALNCGVDEDILTKFIYTVRTGFYETDKEMSAVVLRNDLLTKKIRIQGYTDRKKTAFCVEKAIDDFRNGKFRKRTYSNCGEPIFSKTLIELMKGVKK